MRSLLMFDDRDFEVDEALLQSAERRGRKPQPEHEGRVGERDLISDLELEGVWQAMADDDAIVYVSARTATLSALTDVEQIRYRQAVLADCLAEPAVVREIYGLAVQAIAAERKIWGGIFSKRGEGLLRHSVNVLQAFVPLLERLRSIADEHGDEFASKGFIRFFDTLRRELDDDYFDEIRQHLRTLRFRDGVLVSARLGDGGQGTDYVLRAPRAENRHWYRRVPLSKPTYSYTVPPRDETGAQALGRLRDRGVGLVADALGQSTDHIHAFFAALRLELGFYIGCLNLHGRLVGKGEPVCLPEARPLGTTARSAAGLYDPALSLRLPHRVQGNDLRADQTPLIIITGANQGGKSTFLRSLGLAQLMMQAGMFVPAESFTATVTRGVFTHYRREEDASMTSGKFDEELARMSRIVPMIECGSMLLCNESFAATNEREGSEIADELLQAMTDLGVTVVFVTHLYELAHHYREQHADTTLFLRADRGSDGQRSYRLVEAAPLPTSYGEDLYRRTFGTSAPTASRTAGITSSRKRRSDCSDDSIGSDPHANEPAR